VPRSECEPGTRVRAAMSMHRRPANDVVESLRTDVRRGLTNVEVRSRLEWYGRNELATEKATPAWLRSVAQFQDVLVILLLIATGISAGLWACERDTSVRTKPLPSWRSSCSMPTLGYVHAGTSRGRGSATDVCRGRCGPTKNKFTCEIDAVRECMVDAQRTDEAPCGPLARPESLGARSTPAVSRPFFRW
jgi:hypothetical protein